MVRHIKGMLFAIGGVLYVGNEPIHGAHINVSELKKRYAVRFLTNTARKRPELILKDVTQPTDIL